MAVFHFPHTRHLPEIFANTGFPCSHDLESHDVISYSAGIRNSTLHTTLGQAGELCIPAVAIPSLPPYPAANARGQQGNMCHQRPTSAPPHTARAKLGDIDIPSEVSATRNGQITVIKRAPSGGEKDPGLQHKPKVKERTR